MQPTLWPECAPPVSGHNWNANTIAAKKRETFPRKHLDYLQLGAIFAHSATFACQAGLSTNDTDAYYY